MTKSTRRSTGLTGSSLTMPYGGVTTIPAPAASLFEQQTHADEMDSLRDRLAHTALHNRQEERNFIPVESSSISLKNDVDSSEYDDDSSESSDIDMEIDYLEFVVRQLSGAGDTPNHNLRYVQLSHMPDLNASNGCLPRGSITHRVAPLPTNSSQGLSNYQQTFYSPEGMLIAAAAPPPISFQPACGYQAALPGTYPNESFLSMHPSAYVPNMSCLGPSYINQDFAAAYAGHGYPQQLPVGSSSQYMGPLPTPVTPNTVVDIIPSYNNEGLMADEMLGLVDTLEVYMTDLDDLVDLPTTT